MESMEVHARRIREYEFKYGRLEVETLDAIFPSRNMLVLLFLSFITLAT